MAEQDEGRGDGTAALVVDAANVVGARPDGWWRDRAGAAGRLHARLEVLVGAEVVLPGGRALRVVAVHAVLEGAARSAQHTGRVAVHRAPADGDAAVAALAHELAHELVHELADEPDGPSSGRADGRRGPPPGALVVATADRGLRARLPAAALAVGPGWLLGVLDALPAADGGQQGGGR